MFIILDRFWININTFGRNVIESSCSQIFLVMGYVLGQRITEKNGSKIAFVYCTTLFVCMSGYLYKLHFKKIQDLIQQCGAKFTQ
jgi:hypothetical protein